MIRVFQPADTTFTSNGDVVLRPLRAKVHKEDNNDFYLDIETSTEFADYLVEDNIIVAPTPQGDQPFRINNVTYTRNKVSFRAWHVFYDSEDVTIADTYVVNKNGNSALNQLNNACYPASPLTVSSNVETIASFRCVRKSLYEAFETVLERWGGHLVRDGFHVSLMDSIGTDNGIVVEYRKNLKEITKEEDWSEVTTTILPVGKDGILINALLPSSTVYMASTTQYDIPYCKVVSFDQDHIEEDDYSSETAYKQALVNDLRAQAQDWLDTHNLPAVNYKLKANVDYDVDVGDTIHVKDHQLNVNLLSSVISYTWDCLAKRYTELEFGNFTPSLSNLVPSLTASLDKKVAESTQGIQQQVNNTQSEIETKLVSGTVVMDGTKLMALDSLPQSSANNVLMLTASGWSRTSGGINGDFTNFLSMDGVRRVGGADNACGSVAVLDASGNVIATINNSGIVGTNLSYNGSRVLINNYDMFYQSGETSTIANAIAGGVANSTAVTFTITLPKFSNGTPTITALRCNVYGNGVIKETSGGHDMVSDSTITVSCEVSSRNLLTVKLTGLTATSQACVADIKSMTVRW